MKRFVLLNSGFRTRKNLFENFLQFGHALSKIFASPDLGGKLMQNNVSKGDTMLACRQFVIDASLQFVWMSEQGLKYPSTVLEDFTPLNFDMKH